MLEIHSGHSGTVSTPHGAMSSVQDSHVCVFMYIYIHLFIYLFSCCRKAISRTGLQHLAPAHPLGLPVVNGPAKEPRATLDWSVGVCCLFVCYLKFISVACCVFLNSPSGFYKSEHIFSGHVVRELTSWGLKAIVATWSHVQGCSSVPPCCLLHVLVCVGEKVMGERRGVFIVFNQLEHKNHMYLWCAMWCFDTWAQCVMFKSAQSISAQTFISYLCCKHSKSPFLAFCKKSTLQYHGLWSLYCEMVSVTFYPLKNLSLDYLTITSGNHHLALSIQYTLW